MIEIMLWKFLWTYQKNHAIENHTMENHVRRGLTVIGLKCFLGLTTKWAYSSKLEIL